MLFTHLDFDIAKLLSNFIVVGLDWLVCKNLHFLNQGYICTNLHLFICMFMCGLCKLGDIVRYVNGTSHLLELY